MGLKDYEVYYYGEIILQLDYSPEDAVSSVFEKRDEEQAGGIAAVREVGQSEWVWYLADVDFTPVYTAFRREPPAWALKDLAQCEECDLN